MKKTAKNVVSDIPEKLYSHLQAAFFCLRFSNKVSKLYFFLQMLYMVVAVIFPFALIDLSRKVLNLLSGSSVQKNMQDISVMLILLCVGYYGVGLLSKLADTWNLFLEGLYQSKMDRMNTLQMMEKAAKLQMQWYDSSAFYDHIRDASVSGPIIVHTALRYVELIRYVITFFVAFVVLARWNILLALIMTIAVIPTVVLQNRQVKAVYQLQWEQYSEERKMNYAADISFRKECAVDLRLYGFLPMLRKKYTDSWHTMFEKKKRVTKKYTVLHSIFSVLPEAISCVAIASIGNAVLRGEASVGDFSYYQGMIGQVLGNIQMIMLCGSQILEGTLRIDKYRKFLDMDEECSGRRELQTLEECEIEFRDVSFRYSDDAPYVLKNINFKIYTGDRVALVGTNGSGKTTILKLLLRLYDPTEGVILVNGTDLREFDLRQYRGLFGAVMQDYFHYAFSVRESISLSDLGNAADQKKLWQSLEDSTAADFVRELPQKENTSLTRAYMEDGVELSGGQWQKIALASAFFRDAKIYILDEPSSALDAAAETELFQCMEKLSKNKTTITVTHRLSNIAGSDKILVLDRGKLIEKGTHRELMNMHGQYENLFRMQADRYAIE